MSVQGSGSRQRVNRRVFDAFRAASHRAYVVALLLIALSLVFAFLVLDGFIAAQGDAATTINVAGRQRVLAQKIESLAADYSQTTDAEARKAMRRTLNAEINALEKTNQDLVAGDAERGLPGIKTRAEAYYYFGPPHHVDQHVRAFVAAARAVLEETNAAKGTELADALAQSARRDLLPALDAALAHYETVALQRADQTRLVHLALLAAIFLVLVAEGVFIFAPITRRFSATLAAMRTAQMELARIATHDELTGLKNRRALAHYRDAHVADTEREHTVLAIDLDNFKDVNDRFGHACGDDLLNAFGAIIKRQAGLDALNYRLGGDEFVVVLPGEMRASEAQLVAERVRAELMTICRTTAEFQPVSASFGIASGVRRELEGIIADADTALYFAKSEGRNRIVHFTPAMRLAMEARLDERRFLHDMMQNDQVVPYFQPQIELRTGRVVAVEALVRFSADGAIKSPGHLIETAIASGQIIDLGRTMMKKSIAAAAQWRDQELSFGRLSLNASASELCDPHFLPALLSELQRHGLAPGSVAIDVAETAFFQDDDTALMGAAQALADAGVGMILDDFGTGYGAITGLGDFPADGIKIDRSFVRCATKNPRCAKLLRSIVDIGRQARLRVSAEGVETKAERDLLNAAGCEFAQGFLLAPPMDEDEIKTWLGNAARKAQPALIPALLTGTSARIYRLPPKRA